MSTFVGSSRAARDSPRRERAQDVGRKVVRRGGTLSRLRTRGRMVGYETARAGTVPGATTGTPITRPGSPYPEEGRGQTKGSTRLGQKAEKMWARCAESRLDIS